MPSMPCARQVVDTQRRPFLLLEPHTVFTSLAHRIVNRLPSHEELPVLPTLTVDRTIGDTQPTAWFICPDYNRPSGGVRKLYRCVDILNDAGGRAAIIHRQPGFRCNWFVNATRVEYPREMILKPRDVVVVPEIYGRSIAKLPRGIQQVIFNQNIYNTLRLLGRDAATAMPYVQNPDLAFVVVVSEDNALISEHLFPGTPIRRLRLGLDHDLFYPPPIPKRTIVAYMPRKRGHDSARVLDLLRLRGALNGWDVMAIDGCNEVEVAERLRSAKLFLSFAQEEGFGLPALEALACGCIVVGYHGYGGREFFLPPLATPVEEGNIAAFAHAAENAIQALNLESNSMTSCAHDAARFVRDNYNLDIERQSLIEIFDQLMH